MNNRLVMTVLAFIFVCNQFQNGAIAQDDKAVEEGFLSRTIHDENISIKLDYY